QLKNVAVILAGGNGVRMGLDRPKQLLKIAGKPILEHTLEVFERAKKIDIVILMMNKGHIREAEEIISRRKFTKVLKVVEGGSTRNQTTKRALQQLEYENCNVLFHDAVRPLLTEEIINRCINALEKYDAVDVAIPSADTIVEVAD